MNELEVQGFRFVCTKEHPWKPEIQRPTIHPEAIEINEDYYGLGCTIITYECPHCGKVFREELPQ